MKYSRRTKYKTRRKSWFNFRRFNGALKRLIKPTAEAAKAIEEMGIQFDKIAETAKAIAIKEMENRMDRAFREGKNPILNAGWMRLK